MVTVEPLPHPLLQLFQPLTGDFHIGDDVGVGEVSVKQLPRERILLRGLPFRKTFRLPFRKALSARPSAFPPFQMVSNAFAIAPFPCPLERAGTSQLQPLGLLPVVGLLPF